ncbi:MAG: HEAT repeat domain-containing protein, partial [Gemmatimonadaceae bacterium]
MIPVRAKAQDIARRVATAGNGKVRFTYPARPELCGYNNSISRGADNHMTWSSNASPDVEYDHDCSKGPVRLVLYVDGGRVNKIRAYVDGEWRPATTGVTDLGALSAKDATDYLLSLATTDAGSVGRDAIMPLTFADGVVVWPRLFNLVRDENRPRSTRKQAMFWLGQAAGEQVAGRVSFAKDDDATEVKKSAVFALSQRRNNEAVSSLIEVARNNRDAEVRKSALFWLGQTMDPRAIGLFEELLRSRN